MVRNRAGTQSGDIGKTKKKAYLRSYKDLKCPYCGSDVYWGTHKCRRCGKTFPEDLVNEVERRKLMHYIPIDYKIVARERYIAYIITTSTVLFLTFILVSMLGRIPISEDVRLNYIMSWVFFIITIIPALLTIFYFAEPDSRIMTRANLQLTAMIIGTSGLVVGFIGIIQVAYFKAGDYQLFVCSIFIVLAALAIALARSSWQNVTKFQLALVISSAVFFSWVFLRTFIEPDFIAAFRDSGGGMIGTFIIILLGTIIFITASYFIFYGSKFQVRISNCYPTWFAGMTFISLFAFFRAALFRTEMELTYVEALILTIGIFLTLLGLLLFFRKKMADSYLQTHLAFSQRVLAQAENQYAKGQHREALDRLEKLLVQNPTLVFGESNDHPALELLGIDFVPRQVKDKPVETISDKKAIDDPEGKDEEKSEIEFENERGREEESAPESPSANTDADGEPEVAEPDGEEGADSAHQTPNQKPEDNKLDPQEEEELRRAEALALLKKSSFYEKSGQRQKALACIERSIKLDRGRAESWIQLGHLNSKVGGDWEKIRGYYDWVVDLKLRTIQNWVDHEDVPPQYLLWFMEELSVLKRNLHALGRSMRTLRGARI